MPRSTLLIDLSPLRRFRQFRILWSGFVIRTIGNQLTVVAVPYEVFRLTHSSLDVGLVSTVQLGPLLIGSFLGGAVIDAVDRRRLLIATQILLASTSVGLALDCRGHPAVWPLFVCSALAAGFQGVDNPASSALTVSTVNRESIVAANALWQALFNTGQIAGPAIAGILLARFSVGLVFWIDVASYGVSLVTVLRLAPIPKLESYERGDGGFGAMLGGLRYVRANQSLQGIFLADLNAMVLGMPRALFPAMALVRFHGGATALGLLYATVGIGALIGAALTGWVSLVKRQGRAVLIAVAVWGGAIALFGLSPWFWLALVFLALAGAADLFSAVFRGSILQLASPRGMLGRIQAVQTAVVTGGPRLGDLEHGALGSVTSSETAIVSGGIACIVGAILLAKLLPRFSTFTIADTPGEDDGGMPAPPSLDGE